MERLLRTLRLRDSYGATAFGIVLVGVVAVVSVLGLIGGGLYALSREECANKAEAMGRDWKAPLIGGCLVRTDGGSYVPLDNYRLTNEEAR